MPSVPAPYAAEGVKGRECSKLLAYVKGLELVPWLADVQQLLNVALEYSSTLLCFTPSLQTSQFKGKQCQHMLQLTQPSGFRPCPLCPLILQLVAFAFASYVCKVCPGLAVPVWETVSQQGLVNPHAACIKLYL